MIETGTCRVRSEGLGINTHVEVWTGTEWARVKGVAALRFEISSGEFSKVTMEMSGFQSDVFARPGEIKFKDAATLSSRSDIELIDPEHLVYRVTDGFDNLISLRDSPMGSLTHAGDVVDLYVGATPPGCYRTCAANGLIQLGSTPAGQLVCVASRG